MEEKESKDRNSSAQMERFSGKYKLLKMTKSFPIFKKLFVESLKSSKA